MRAFFKGILGVLGFWIGLGTLAYGAIYYPTITLTLLLIFVSVLVFLLVYGESSWQ